MKAGIINIGDELLIGDTVNTNASWISKALDGIGCEVIRIYTIGDQESEIHSHLDLLTSLVDVIIITGGLGPTHDDVTKFALNSYYKDELKFHPDVYEDLLELLKRFGRGVSDLNRTQAELPSKCTVLRNSSGTAPGMMFEENEVIVYSFPGVPREMKHLMKTHVIPNLQKRIAGGKKIHKHVKTFGVPESDLSEQLKDILENLDKDLKIAFLPSPGYVKIRVSAMNNLGSGAEQRVEEVKTDIINELKDIVYGFEGDHMETVVGQLLKDQNLSVATAESCTGGKLASMITSVPGSSAYFLGSVVSYDNNVKMNSLKVSEDALETFGAVSEQVVCEMAKNVRDIMKADFGLATSGIAGPDGGTEDKPVGTIWIAISGKNGTTAEKLNLGYNRELNVYVTSSHVLNMLRKELLKNI